MRPKTQLYAPSVASLTRLTPQTKKLKTETQLTNNMTPVKTITVPSLLNNNSNNNKQTNLQPIVPKAVLKNVKTYGYDEEFYTKAHERMKCLRQVTHDKPDLFLKQEVKYLHKRRRKGLFVLQQHKLARVARRGGIMEIDKFLYNSKPSSTWPESIPRPTFRVAWQHRVAEAKQLATIGHLLRMLHCCLKWDVINNKPSKGVNRSITSNKGKFRKERSYSNSLDTNKMSDISNKKSVQDHPYTYFFR